MSIELCTCVDGIPSLGSPHCAKLIKTMYRPDFTNFLKSDGTNNTIDLTGNPDLNSTYWSGKVTTTTNPLRPSQVIHDAATERAAAKYQEFDNGAFKRRLETGIRTVKCVLVDVPPSLVDYYLAMNCDDVGFYFADMASNYVGIKYAYNVLRPIRVAKGSIDALYVGEERGKAGMIMLSWDWDESECDSQLQMIQSSDFDQYDIKQLQPLVQVELQPHLVATSTTVKVAANTNQGSMTSPLLVLLLVAGDFILTNTTTGLVIAKTLTEILGKYVLTYVAQTAGDRMTLSCTKTGYTFFTYKFTAL